MCSVIVVFHFVLLIMPSVMDDLTAYAVIVVAVIFYLPLALMSSKFFNNTLETFWLLRASILWKEQKPLTQHTRKTPINQQTMKFVVMCTFTTTRKSKRTEEGGNNPTDLLTVMSVLVWFVVRLTMVERRLMGIPSVWRSTIFLNNIHIHLTPFAGWFDLFRPNRQMDSSMYGGPWCLEVANS